MYSQGQPLPGSKEQLREAGAKLLLIIRKAIVAQMELCAMACAYVDLPCEGDIGCAAAGGSGPKARLARRQTIERLPLYTVLPVISS